MAAEWLARRIGAPVSIQTHAAGAGRLRGGAAARSVPGAGHFHGRCDAPAFRQIGAAWQDTIDNPPHGLEPRDSFVKLLLFSAGRFLPPARLRHAALPASADGFRQDADLFPITDGGCGQAARPVSVALERGGRLPVEGGEAAAQFGETDEHLVQFHADEMLALLVPAVN